MESNTFQSARLFYRAIESPADDDFFHALHADPISAAMSSPAIQKPLSRKRTTAMRESFQDALLGVMICLPTTPENLTLAGLDEDSEAVAKDKEGSDKDKVPRTKPSLIRPTLDDRGIPVGAMCLQPQHSGLAYLHHRYGDVGIDIAPRFQRRGYGTEALRWVLRWGFKHAHLHRIGIRTLGWNEGALRLYQNLGFVLESRERQLWWYDGRWWDDLGLGMLEDEWRERYGEEDAVKVPPGR